MKNLLILVLIAVIAYLLYTSGTLSRAVKSVQTAVPALGTITGDENTTPEISVTVYSPYGTGPTLPPIQVTVLAPHPFATQQPGAPQPTVAQAQPLAPMPTAQPANVEPTAFLVTPPPPTIIVPAVPPTLAVATTPTPSGIFVITIDSPHEGETVHTAPLTVRGQTTPNAVISVNDAVAIADAQGHFSLNVPLDAGPNVLEIIASKTTGEQVFAILTILYQP